MKNSMLTIREEIAMYGVEKVSDIKVLAELSGAKEDVISALFKEWGSLSRVCSNAEFSNNLTKRQVEKILMVSELLGRNTTLNKDEIPNITQPEHIVSLVEDLRHKDQEEFTILCLNTKNELIKRVDLFRGGRRACVIDSSVLFREALRYGSNSIVMVHNHPSGNPEPSAEDVELTSRIVEGGRLINIRVLDHIIIASKGHISLKEKHLM